MISNCVKFSLFAFTIIVLCITSSECQNFDTATNGYYYASRSTYPTSYPRIPTNTIIRSKQDLSTTTTTTTHLPWIHIITSRPLNKLPKIKIKFSNDRYIALFGGLSGTTLGLYLGSQIDKIDWEADMPAYSVRHYWHPQGYPLNNNTIVEASDIVECPKNVSICVPNSIAMCLSNGKINCVTSEFQTLPCRTYGVGACLPTTLRIKCKNMWGVDCFLTGYKDVNLYIPCLKHIRVRYTGYITKYNENFYFSSNYSRTPDKNNTCECNNSQLIPSKIDLSCIKLNVSEAEKIFCSGLNLTTLISITLNSSLNSSNTKKISCSLLDIAGSMGDIFEAQSKSTLARCEFENGSFGVNMKCGNIANLYNRNVSIPVESNVAALRCSMENATSLNQACRCNSGVTPVKPIIPENPGKTPVYTVRYCVAVAAYPMWLYNNEDYMYNLNRFPELERENGDAFNNLLTVMGRYIMS